MTKHDQEKLQNLCEDFGFDSPEDLCEEYITDAVCPGICMNPLCDYSIEVEPDCRDGWCELCETNSVKSAMIILGII